MAASDWKAQMPSDLRLRILDSITNTLNCHLSPPGPSEMDSVRQLAVQFEERTYTAASDQMDYLQKIFLKMAGMESQAQNAHSTNLQSGCSAFTNNPSDQGQAGNQSQYFLNSLPANQQFSSQNIQSFANISGSAGLPQATFPGVVAQGNANIQNPYGAWNSCFQMGEGVPSNILASSQIQMPDRAQILPQQQQPQPQNANYMYRQKMQHQHGNLCHPYMQEKQQQQHNQSLGQPIQQTPSVMLQQPFVQSAVPSHLSSVQQSSIQQLPPPVLRQKHHTQQNMSIHQKPMPGGDWQEELYQKINALKEMYLRDLTALLEKCALKLQQTDLLPQQQIPDSRIKKIRLVKMNLEWIIEFLNVLRSGVSEMHRERFSSCEKQILILLRPTKPMGGSFPILRCLPHLNQQQNPCLP